ncbi:MAG TPA: dsRBD fold-containing protein [Microlunatus sp.]|nr:dsRBD fold-containing protein [Microlunatus sp.]
MRAAVGDHMVVASARLDGPVRDGEILKTGPDGEGPYLVRWSDDGRETLFFPGVDAHVQHEVADPAEAEKPSVAPGSTPHVKSWSVDVYLYEGAGSTSANAVLHSGVEPGLWAHGDAKLRPGEHDVPEIGDEVAVARALRGLADALLSTAESDLGAIEGHRVQLRL